MATPQEKNIFIQLAMLLVRSLHLTPTTGANINLNDQKVISLFGTDDICLTASDKSGNTAFISSLGRNHSHEVMQRFQGGYSRHSVQYEAGWLLAAGLHESISDVTKSLTEYFKTNYKLDFLGSANGTAMSQYYHRSLAVKNFIQHCEQHIGSNRIVTNCFSTVSRTNSGNWGISSFVCIALGDVVLNIEYSQDGILGCAMPVHTEEQINSARSIALGAVKALCNQLGEDTPAWGSLSLGEQNVERAKVMQILIDPKTTGKALHANWKRTMEVNGWRLGGNLCHENKFHPIW